MILSGYFGIESASRLKHDVVPTSVCCAAVGLRCLFPCWMWTRDCSHVAEATCISWLMASSIEKPVKLYRCPILFLLLLSDLNQSLPSLLPHSSILKGLMWLYWVTPDNPEKSLYFKVNWLVTLLNSILIQAPIPSIIVYL